MSARRWTAVDSALLAAIVLCLSLAGLIALVPLRLIMPAPEIPAVVDLVYNDNPEFQMALFDDFAVIAARPVFAEDRRPRPGSAASDDPLSGLRLLGTLMLPEGGLALLGDSTSGAVMRLRQGERFQGWRIEAITAESVTLSRDDQAHVLPLRVPGE